ncbi:hypothetical protein D3C86_1603990 [compost metagenome]
MVVGRVTIDRVETDHLGRDTYRLEIQTFEAERATAFIQLVARRGRQLYTRIRLHSWIVDHQG